MGAIGTHARLRLSSQVPAGGVRGGGLKCLRLAPHPWQMRRKRASSERQIFLWDKTEQSSHSEKLKGNNTNYVFVFSHLIAMALLLLSRFHFFLHLLCVKGVTWPLVLFFSSHALHHPRWRGMFFFFSWCAVNNGEVKHWPEAFFWTVIMKRRYCWLQIREVSPN